MRNITERDTTASRIRKIRSIRGYTQKTLSEKAKINVAQLQMYEYGTRIPRERQLNKIADALDIDVSFLLPSYLDNADKILSFLFDLIIVYGEINLESKHDDDIVTSITVNPKGKGEWFNRILYDVMNASESLSKHGFMNWLMDIKHNKDLPYSKSIDVYRKKLLDDNR